MSTGTVAATLAWWLLLSLNMRSPCSWTYSSLIRYYDLEGTEYNQLSSVAGWFGWVGEGESHGSR